MAGRPRWDWQDFHKFLFGKEIKGKNKNMVILFTPFFFFFSYSLIWLGQGGSGGWSVERLFIQRVQMKSRKWNGELKYLQLWCRSENIHQKSNNIFLTEPEPTTIFATTQISLNNFDPISTGILTPTGFILVLVQPESLEEVSDFPMKILPLHKFVLGRTNENSWPVVN